MVLYGTYREIQRPSLLVYSWAWEGMPGETLVTLEIDPHESGTELTITHEGFTDPEQASQHQDGWDACLVRIVDTLNRDR